MPADKLHNTLLAERDDPFAGVFGLSRGAGRFSDSPGQLVSLHGEDYRFNVRVVRRGDLLGPQQMFQPQAGLEPHASDEPRLEFYRPEMTMLGTGIIHTWYGMWLGASAFGELRAALRAQRPLQVSYPAGRRAVITDVPAQACRQLLDALGSKE